MNIHLLLNHPSMAYPTVNYYDTFFPRDHVFWIIRSTKVNWNDECLVKHARVKKVVSSNLLSEWKYSYQIVKELSKTDGLIFLHNLTVFSFRMMVLALFLFPSVVSRCVWLSWGSDLYGLTNQIQVKKNIPIKIYRNICFRFVNNLKMVVTCFPADQNLVREKFKKVRKVISFPYVGLPTNQINEEEKLDFVKSNKSTIKVLCGHRTTEAVCNLEGLKLLSKYCNENINIYIPACGSGDEGYYDSVKKCAEEIFGDKVIYIPSYLTLSQLNALSKEMDVILMPTYRRQVALGTIKLFLKHHKKVFLSQKSEMFNFFDSQNVEIYKCEDIKAMSFDEFSQPIKDFSGADRYVESTSDKAKLAAEWAEILKKL